MEQRLRGAREKEEEFESERGRVNETVKEREGGEEELGRESERGGQKGGGQGVLAHLGKQ